MPSNTHQQVAVIVVHCGQCLSQKLNVLILGGRLVLVLAHKVPKGGYLLQELRPLLAQGLQSPVMLSSRCIFVF